MSDNTAHEDHTGPIKTPMQLLVVVALSFVAPVFVIIGLVYYVTSDAKPAAGVVDKVAAANALIQKVGTVEVRDANRPLKAGAEVYAAQCAACHNAGVANSPKLGDSAAWAPRLKAGLDTLVASALKGKGAMAAQGGGDFDDTEIARAVVHLANAAGGKFAEPQRPTAAAK